MTGNHEEVAARLRLSGIHSHLLGSRKGENFWLPI